MTQQQEADVPVSAKPATSSHKHLPTAPKAPEAASKPEEEEEGGAPMTFWEHLDELRKRIVWSVLAFLIATVLAWQFKETILQFAVLPFEAAWKARLPSAPNLNFATPGGAFVSYFKLSMIGGAILAAPMIFYQLWSFVAPGLYAREKRYVIPFVFFSTVLFVGGGLFAWRYALPITFDYFLGLSGTVGSTDVRPTIMMDQYIDFISQIFLGFGITFELPLLLLFLSIAGIINYLHLIQFGRWFVLVAFIVAAILTPPDAASQLTMAIPMVLLYGLSIGLAFLFGQKPTAEQREAFRNRKKKQGASS